MTEDFSQIKWDTNPQIEGAQRIPIRINANANKYIIFKPQKIKDKEKFWKKPEEKNTLHIEEQKWELHPTFPQKPCKWKKGGVKYLKYWERKKETTQNSVSSVIILNYPLNLKGK